MTMSHKKISPWRDTQEKYFQVRALSDYGFSYTEIKKYTGIAQSAVSYITKESTRAKTKAYSKTHQNILKAYISNFKLLSKCLECKFDANAEGLDLDHIKSLKNFNIAKGIRYKSRPQVISELAFCVVRCATCHRYKTYQEENKLSSAELNLKIYDPQLLTQYQFHLEQKFLDANHQAPLKDTRELISKYVYMLKEASPCSDCQKHYRFFAMDYDHVRGEKIANIEQIIRRSITHFPAL